MKEDWTPYGGLDWDVAAIRKLLSFAPLDALDVYLPLFKFFSHSSTGCTTEEVVESFPVDIFLIISFILFWHKDDVKILKCKVEEYGELQIIIRWTIHGLFREQVKVNSKLTF